MKYQGKFLSAQEDNA